MVQLGTSAAQGEMIESNAAHAERQEGQHPARGSGAPYHVVPLDIGLGAQFSPQYLALNTNHRMPAIVDHEPLGGGAPISVFESGAILMYLAEKAGRFWPQTPREKYEVAQWVMWQMANQGPKFGESGHFRRASQKPENGDLKYALRRRRRVNRSSIDEQPALRPALPRWCGLLDRRHDQYPWSMNWRRSART